MPQENQQVAWTPPPEALHPICYPPGHCCQQKYFKSMHKKHKGWAPLTRSNSAKPPDLHLMWLRRIVRSFVSTFGVTTSKKPSSFKSPTTNFHQPSPPQATTPSTAIHQP